jgi:hypothetical protein
MQFQKGESGNPAGRPRGARNRTTILLQKLLEDDGEALARKAIDLAKGGDLAALRMCMDRLMPARKHEPVAFELPQLDTAADTVTAAATIVAAVAAGELTPSEAADIAKVVDIYVRALATQGFEERLAKLEGNPRARANIQRRSRPMPQPPLPPLPSNRLNKLEKTRTRERRVFFIWKDPSDTPADVEAKRDRLIAEGTARADDEFIHIRWRRSDEK